MADIHITDHTGVVTVTDIMMVIMVVVTMAEDMVTTVMTGHTGAITNMVTDHPGLQVHCMHQQQEHRPGNQATLKIQNSEVVLEPVHIQI
jgi:hypothetical protein